MINRSSNATDLAASHQWNDVYTMRRPQAGVYDEYREVFRQMWRDKNVRPRVTAGSTGSDQVGLMPTPTPAKAPSGTRCCKELNRTRCTGARNSRQRADQDPDRDDLLARQARQATSPGGCADLQNNGCDIQIIYAVVGNEVLRMLRHEGRRPVPMRQIVQDFNGDGVYDRYLHTKVITIKGRYRGDRRACDDLQRVGELVACSPGQRRGRDADLGSEAGQALQRLDRPLVPESPRSAAPSAQRRTAGPVDAYANIQPD